MEMCLGEQQFVTLLFYLDDICIFAASIDKMLDHIELLFKWLEEFNLKIKPKEMPFLSAQHNIPWACTISRRYICKPQEGKKLASANQPKRITIILGLASYYCCFIPQFAAIAKFLHQLVGTANHQKSKKNKSRIVNQKQNKNQDWIDKLSSGQANIKKCSTF